MEQNHRVDHACDQVHLFLVPHLVITAHTMTGFDHFAARFGCPDDHHLEIIEKLGKAGQKKVRDEYSVDAVYRKMKESLNQIEDREL